MDVVDPARWQFAVTTLSHFPVALLETARVRTLPLLPIRPALVVRGVAFAYRGKRHGRRWWRNGDRCLFWGSLVPAFLWGVVFGTIVRGIALDENREFAGTFWDPLNPFALLGGLTTPALFVTHGVVFPALKTRGRIRRKAKGAAEKRGVVAAVLVVAFLTWAEAAEGSIAGAGMVADFFGREGWAFLGSAVIGLFAALHPEALPSTAGSENGLNIENAASTSKIVQIMTWAAVVFLPLMLVYQSWTYWVFRRRIGVRNIPAGHN
ncbi:cytochrome d ubiquinol oxidase subunit II [Herbidospora sp. NEAU-GS84]|uniref:Cytochrome d ubiquinol oxidase subunit II n=1 Tax=Herbidospora solisilvae TaxID=2696284 RepID=A0A7C9JAS7_9ACTN|nr:cytochrome d ubiquinol oxidase subunit II [Herbidospora solisilvae]NAS21704.1 cytochrome d ubiquinol oxidase subunit II [Herbidospora solisilvae]